MKINDGVSVYPWKRKGKTGLTAYEETVFYDGISYRRYAATEAMKSLLVDEKRRVFYFNDRLDVLAKDAFACADAMIRYEEEEKKGEK